MMSHSVLGSPFPSSQVPLLIRDEGVMKPNLHPAIVAMLEEAKWMQRLGMQVPPTFHTLSMSNVKQTYDQLKVCLCQRLGILQSEISAMMLQCFSVWYMYV